MNYKGMDANMQCRGFQYEVGKEYETDEAVACKTGFHACEYPLDVINYYAPAESRYAVVEQSGKISKSGEDTKVASTKIKIVAEIGLAGLVEAAVEYTTTRAKEEPGGHATGNQGAASATGYQGAASATGYQGAASATGNQGAASATGNQGAASATGYQGAASATGKAGVALAAGFGCKAKGAIGCAICVVERGNWDGETYPIINIKAAIVDGDIIKADTYYMLINGAFVEA
ncbi:DUF7666 domain-containing protein [Intestinimonas butyriciproducens]|uniref:DUF7666 domain-containing protein n=1 Tax=Intestinimonas butyriciproducens TaxID=1297617 RepID=A0A2U1BEJ0_9FIRM|nr:hypothetical protein [Intestinimonas butyriciproducens]MCR1905156.1 hypothetical protein [Intestinimonas butyriciproducens]PVY47033.1 hypothetical protein C7373_11136 [Intestinimonas butyriciproducens]